MVNGVVVRVVGVNVDKELGQEVVVEVVVVGVVGTEVDVVQLVLVSGLGLGLDQPSPQGSMEYCSPGIAPAMTGLVTNARKAMGRSIMVNRKLLFNNNRIEN